MPSVTSPHLLRHFVGPGADAYLARWAAADAGQRPWNRGALLAGPLWAARRRMALPAVLYLACVGAVMVADLFTPRLPALLPWAVLGLALLFGRQGDRWYRRHAWRRVTALATRHGADALPAALSQAGGTRWAGVVWVVLLAPPLLLGVAGLVVALYRAASG